MPKHITTSTLVIIKAQGEGTSWRDCMVPLVHLLGSSPTQRYLGKQTQPLSLILASQLGEGRLYVAETHTCGLCEQQWFNSRQISKRTPFANCKHNPTRPQIGLLGPYRVIEDCHLQVHPPPDWARMWHSVLFPSFGHTVAAYSLKIVSPWTALKDCIFFQLLSSDPQMNLSSLRAPFGCFCFREPRAQ